MNDERRRSYVVRVVAAYALFASLWSYASDTVLAQIADHELLMEISVFKGLLFVVTTAALLVVALLRMPGREETRTLARTTGSMAPLLALAAAVAAVLTIAHFAYRAQSATIQKDAIQKLEALARLEVDAIGRWIENRRSDAEVTARDPARRQVLERWIDTRNSEDGDTLEEALVALRSGHEFHGVALVDAVGRLLLGDEEALSDTAEFRSAVARAGTGTRVTLLDLHRRPDGTVHMAWLAPIFDREMRRGDPLAVLVVDVDAATWLYPYLASWPLPSRTGENAMVRREGDKVLSLADTRFAHTGPLTRRLSLDRLDQPIVRHIRFGETSAAGVDYRGERVLAAMATIPSTGWILVAKMDEAEALADLQGLAFGTGLSILLVLIAGLGIAILSWQRQRLDAAYREIDQRHRAQAAEQRFRSTFEQAAVGIAHVGLDGGWIRHNRRLAEIAGYDDAELTAVPIVEILHPDERIPVGRALRRLVAGESRVVAAERRIRHRDGSVVWVAITASLRPSPPLT